MRPPSSQDRSAIGVVQPTYSGNTPPIRRENRSSSATQEEIPNYPEPVHISRTGSGLFSSLSSPTEAGQMIVHFPRGIHCPVSIHFPRSFSDIIIPFWPAPSVQSDLRTISSIFPFMGQCHEIMRRSLWTEGASQKGIRMSDKGQIKWIDMGKWRNSVQWTIMETIVHYPRGIHCPMSIHFPRSFSDIIIC